MMASPVDNFAWVINGMISAPVIRKRYPGEFWGNWWSHQNRVFSAWFYNHSQDLVRFGGLCLVLGKFSFPGQD